MNIWIQTAFYIVHSSQLLTLQMLPLKFAKDFFRLQSTFLSENGLDKVLQLC